MDLEILYRLQYDLDKHILKNNFERTGIEIPKEELLEKTILALLVEVGELANTTRCFKHWSTKGMMDKEIVLDELADVIHFYLSIGNQKEIQFKPMDKYTESEVYELSEIFITIYRKASELQLTNDFVWDYFLLGDYIILISKALGFTDKAIMMAYLKKHEENYKRQREGY